MGAGVDVGVYGGLHTHNVGVYGSAQPPPLEPRQELAAFELSTAHLAKMAAWLRSAAPSGQVLCVPRGRGRERVPDVELLLLALVQAC